jgi:hypothetical protein
MSIPMMIFMACLIVAAFGIWVAGRDLLMLATAIFFATIVALQILKTESPDATRIYRAVQLINIAAIATMIVIYVRRRLEGGRKRTT